MERKAESETVVLEGYHLDDSFENATRVDERISEDKAELSLEQFSPIGIALLTTRIADEGGFVDGSSVFNGYNIYINGSPAGSTITDEEQLGILRDENKVIKVAVKYQLGDGWLYWEPVLSGDMVESGILTLDEVTIDSQNYGDGAILVPDETTIELIGTNSVTNGGSQKRSIFCNGGDLIIQGNGELNTYGGTGISAKSITIKDTTVNVSFVNGTSGINSYKGNLTIENSTVVSKCDGSATGSGSGAILANGSNANLIIKNSTVTAIDTTGLAGLSSPLGSIEMEDSEVIAIGDSQYSVYSGSILRLTGGSLVAKGSVYPTSITTKDNPLIYESVYSSLPASGCSGFLFYKSIIDNTGKVTDHGAIYVMGDTTIGEDFNTDGQRLSLWDYYKTGIKLTINAGVTVTGNISVPAGSTLINNGTVIGLISGAGTVSGTGKCHAGDITTTGLNLYASTPASTTTYKAGKGEVTITPAQEEGGSVTITLNNAAITTTETNTEGIICPGSSNVKIVLQGDNKITATGHGISQDTVNSVTMLMEGDGNLTIDSDKTAISANILTLDGAHLSMEGANGIAAEKVLTVKGQSELDIHVTTGNGIYTNSDLKVEGTSRIGVESEAESSAITVAGNTNLADSRLDITCPKSYGIENFGNMTITNCDVVFEAGYGFGVWSYDCIITNSSIDGMNATLMGYLEDAGQFTLDAGSELSGVLRTVSDKTTVDTVYGIAVNSVDRSYNERKLIILDGAKLINEKGSTITISDKSKIQTSGSLVNKGILILPGDAVSDDMVSWNISDDGKIITRISETDTNWYRITFKDREDTKKLVYLTEGSIPMAPEITRDNYTLAWMPEITAATAHTAYIAQWTVIDRIDSLEVIEAAPSVSAPHAASEEAKDFAQALTGSEATTAAGLGTAASDMVDIKTDGSVSVTVGSDTITGDDGKAALKEAGIDAEGQNIKLIVEPYVDIQVNNIVEEEGKKILIMDIKAKCNIKASVAEDKDSITEVNTVTMVSGQEMNVTKPVIITFPVPVGFDEEDLYIRHTHNGKVSYYKVTVTDGIASFINTDGFSTFELMSDVRSGKISYDSGIGEMAYTLAEVGEALPTADKSGSTFSGWNISGKKYTVFTEELLNLINGAEGRTVSATAVFASNSTGHSSGGGSSYTSHTTGWSNEGTAGWRYYDSSTSYARNTWRQVNENGILTWYHFGTDGYMNIGWFLDTDGSWYYLNPLSDGTKGAMRTDWYTDSLDGHRYYLDPVSGRMAIGWTLIDGVWYYFNETVPQASGWYLDAGTKQWAYDPKEQLPSGALVEGAKR